MATTNPKSRMSILRGATYSRKVTWNRPLAAAAYKAELTIRRRYDDPLALVEINSVDNPTEISVSQEVLATSVAVQIRLAIATTTGLPLGTEFVASHRLSLLSDPTQGWVLNWPVTVTSSTFSVAP